MEDTKIPGALSAAAEKVARKRWRSLQKNVENALSISQAQTHGDGEISGLFQAALHDMTMMEKLLVGHLRLLPVDPSIATEGSTEMASKIFETPEIAEEIYSYLSSYDLLQVQQVSTYTRDLIKSSIRLQRKMFLVSERRDHFRMLKLPTPVKKNCGDPDGRLRRCKLIFVHNINNETKEGRSMHVSLRFLEVLPKLGSRVHQMYVCRPPVLSLDYSTDCCPSESNATDDVRTIINRDGLTLGDLVNAARTMKEDHKLCPHAPLEQHDENGIVRPTVTFHGSVLLHRKDPEVIKARADEEAEANEGEQTPQEKLIADYIDAKLDGKILTNETYVSS